MDMEKQETEALTFSKWLKEFEDDLVELCINYGFDDGPGTPAKITENIGDYYFLTSVEAYLKLTQLLQEKTKDGNISLLSLLKDSANISEGVSDALSMIDPIRFVPRVFHPEFFPERNTYYFRTHEKCLALAQLLQKSLSSFEKNVKELKLLKMSPVWHRLAKSIHALKTRIYRASYNLDETRVEMIATVEADLATMKLYSKQLGDIESAELPEDITPLLEDLVEISEAIGVIFDEHGATPNCEIYYLRDFPIYEFERKVLGGMERGHQLIMYEANPKNRDNYHQVLINYKNCGQLACHSEKQKGDATSFNDMQAVATMYYGEEIQDSRQTPLADDLQKSLENILVRYALVSLKLLRAKSDQLEKLSENQPDLKKLAEELLALDYKHFVFPASDTLREQKKGFSEFDVLQRFSTLLTVSLAGWPDFEKLMDSLQGNLLSKRTALKFQRSGQDEEIGSLESVQNLAGGIYGAIQPVFQYFRKHYAKCNFESSLADYASEEGSSKSKGLSFASMRKNVLGPSNAKKMIGKEIYDGLSPIMMELLSLRDTADVWKMKLTIQHMAANILELIDATLDRVKQAYSGKPSQDSQLLETLREQVNSLVDLSSQKEAAKQDDTVIESP